MIRVALSIALIAAILLIRESIPKYIAGDMLNRLAILILIVVAISYDLSAALLLVILFAPLLSSPLQNFETFQMKKSDLVEYGPAVMRVTQDWAEVADKSTIIYPTFSNRQS